MSLNSKVDCLSTPLIYHREYENDLPKQIEKNTDLFSQCLRVTKVALPFFGLYKPLSKPLSIVLGSTRVISSIAQMISIIQSGDSQTIGKTVLETAIATTALVCSIFAHPLGMIVTTSHDMIINVTELTQATQDKDYKRAAEISLHIINNALYLTCFFSGSLEWSIASVGFQIFLGLYNSCDEFKKGNYLEGCGHFLMVGIRGHQMSQQVKTLQFKWKVEGIIKKLQTTVNKIDGSSPKTTRQLLELMRDGESQSKNESTTKFMRAKAEPIKINKLAVQESSQNELVNALIKYGNNPDGIPSLLYAAKQGDLHVIKLFVDHGADPLTKCNKGRSALFYSMFSENPDVVAFFINQGIDPNKGIGVKINAINQDSDLEFPWLESTDLESFKLLVKHGFHLHSDFYQGDPNMSVCHLPTFECLQLGRLDFLQFILFNGGDLPKTFKVSETERHIWESVASKTLGKIEGKIECLKWLVSRGFLDTKNIKNYFYLFEESSVEFIGYLIENDYINIKWV